RQAQIALTRHDYMTAANLYDEAWELIVQIGPYIQVSLEAQETKAGLAQARLALAVEAQQHHKYREAKTYVDDIWRVDPQNPAALEFKRENDKLLAEALPTLPSPEAEARVRELILARGTNQTRVQDAKLLFEMGQLDEAELVFKQVAKD